MVRGFMDDEPLKGVFHAKLEIVDIPEIVIGFADQLIAFGLRTIAFAPTR
jgi:hypothetical protein